MYGLLEKALIEAGLMPAIGSAHALILPYSGSSKALLNDESPSHVETAPATAKENLGLLVDAHGISSLDQAKRA